MKTIDISGIGTALYDMVMTISRFPEEDTKNRAEQVSYQCGGPVSTALVAASVLGAKTAYLGTLTDDRYGLEIHADMQHYGVDCSAVQVRSGFTSAFSVIWAAKETASRTIVCDYGTLPHPSFSDISAEHILQSKILHVDGKHLDASVEAAKFAQKHGIRVSMDAGSCYPDIQRLLPFIDHFVAAESFVTKFTGISDPVSAAIAIKKEFSPRVVAVTQGSSGGFYLENGSPVFYRPFSVAAVDTNAAGDVFHGAYLYAVLQEKPTIECLRFAAAVAALKCTRTGGRRAIPNLTQVYAAFPELQNT